MEKSSKIFHESLQCHRVAASYHCTQSNDVGELIDQNPSGSKKKKKNRIYLIVVLNCLRYLARQGIAIQGKHGEGNFTHLLKLLGTKDSTITNRLQQASQNFTYHDVQNELLDIMAKQVLSKKLDNQKMPSL